MSPATILTKTARAAWLSGPSFWLSAMFLITWIRPYTFGVNTIDHLRIVIVLEFLAILAYPFSLNIWDPEARDFRIGCLIPFAGFFGLQVLGIVMTLHKWWPIVTFILLTYDRVRLASANYGNLTAMRGLIDYWRQSAIIFWLGMVASFLLSKVQFGVTDEVISRQQFKGDLTYILAMGTSYYLILGLWTARCAISVPKPREIPVEADCLIPESSPNPKRNS